jgi:hypothetical protein
MAELMNFVFLCHAPADAGGAAALGGWLERNSSCEIRLTQCGAGTPHDLIEAAEQSMSAAAVVLLLSPDSVPERWERKRWEPVLLEEPASSGVGMAFIGWRECRFPDLLRRRDYFGNSLEERRRLKRWLLRRFPRFTELPPYAGSVSAERIESLRTALADDAGTAEDVPADAALAFAHACQTDFEGVLWIDATRRTRGALMGDLARALGLAVPGTVEGNEDAVRCFCASRRMLIVFDNCAELPFVCEGKTSLVRTAPHHVVAPRPFDEVAGVFASWYRSEEATEAALRDVRTALETGGDWDAVRNLGRSAVAALKRRPERAAELLEVLRLLHGLALQQGDPTAAADFDNELSWLSGDTGRRAQALPAPGEQLAFDFA